MDKQLQPLEGQAQNILSNKNLSATFNNESSHPPGPWSKTSTPVGTRQANDMHKPYMVQPPSYKSNGTRMHDMKQANVTQAVAHSNAPVNSSRNDYPPHLGLHLPPPVALPQNQADHNKQHFPWQRSGFTVGVGNISDVCKDAHGQLRAACGGTLTTKHRDM